ncbi:MULTISPECIES: DUF262 domain-containing protein [Microcystis]|jgi:uncharacterized protein with ParB-like and HNH nuclease domain|uniref:DUF262 domain-containing protein n=6 Tax=Microcystis TaxID=1125 RepID=A0A552I8B0_MICVR|nr:MULTISPECIES: DUF262 domain-containing protein [Microcystis]NCQ84526.1 DUF262 domain-containing protein [Microcystis aeruginosa W13-18]NCQ91166.1 DUF262 domain-containing protein [Microcystis aeruginosa LG13-13]NCR04382.1 DUF262 domain-containing protein [Microcystis aeruginosa LG13-03]NCR11109.1 DUF262 domain-containing protein [Microcystis aeruginosa LG13-11]NCR35904.1 DUF262 domain-containing protein [Microcystis aeruginosa S11-05]NCR49397.1 DUF262 domain-containing protein [Microcystis
MPRTHLLDTRTSNFSDLIGNGKIYRVPPFQRDYSWKEENWEDLWQDIQTLYENPDSSHYMGAIVLQGSQRSDTDFTIIDGQQRLVTISILAIAIIEKIQTLIDRGEEAEANRERQRLLKSGYLSNKDLGSLKESSKLILNENNNDFYQSRLINFRPPRNPRSLAKSNQLLWKAFQYFSDSLQKLTSVVNSGKELAIFLTDTVAKRLLFIQINVEDELNAYTVFETLNARGIELSSTDLLKNYLFSLFRGADDLREGQRQWRGIIDTVTMEKFPEFLRYYLSLTRTRVRRERLFKRVRESIQNAESAFKLLEQLEEYSGLFIALNNPNDEFWQDTPDNIPYIREIELFGVKQAYPVLFSAYNKFSSENFTRLLKLVCIISFRYTIVSSLNPNELEGIYNKIAIAINNGEMTTPRQVFEGLRSVYVTDTKFVQDFSILSISTRGQKKKLVRYILWKLEMDESGRSNIAEDGFSIEHILPESPSDRWRVHFLDNEIEEMTYRIGNLIPLEANLNRQIGNQYYTDKQEIYQQSDYALARNIVPEEWTPDTIAKRQESLARRAVHIWKSDFV